MCLNFKSPTQYNPPFEESAGFFLLFLVDIVRKGPCAGEPRRTLETRTATKTSEVSNLDLIHSLQVSNMEWWPSHSNYIKLSVQFWAWACGCRAPAVSRASRTKMNRRGKWAVMKTLTDPSKQWRSRASLCYGSYLMQSLPWK